MAKFLHYIEWPIAPGVPITIGFLGDDPVEKELKGMVTGMVAKGRTVAIKHSSKAGELKACQMVFISRSAKVNVKSVLGGFRGAGVLTVSDVDRFCSMGGMVGFRNEGGKTRFEIDGAAAKREKIAIDPELLQIGRKLK